MEKIIEESKQGESLILENKPENTKKLFIESYGCAMNFSDSEIVLSANGYNTTQPRRSRFGFGKHLLHS
jgi:tRNA-2-methylthio-N6-dimethylallyladenosine synthase